MSLTAEQKQHAQTILVAIYDSSWNQYTPTEKTVDVLGILLKEIAKCNKAISKLLNDLSKASGAGWAIKILKAASKLAKNDKNAFRACTTIAKNNFKTELVMTMM